MSWHVPVTTLFIVFSLRELELFKVRECEFYMHIICIVLQLAAFETWWWWLLSELSTVPTYSLSGTCSSLWEDEWLNIKTLVFVLKKTTLNIPSRKTTPILTWTRLMCYKLGGTFTFLSQSKNRQHQHFTLDTCCNAYQLKSYKKLTMFNRSLLWSDPYGNKKSR